MKKYNTINCTNHCSLSTAQQPPLGGSSIEASEWMYAIRIRRVECLCCYANWHVTKKDCNTDQCHNMI